MHSEQKGVRIRSGRVKTSLPHNSQILQAEEGFNLDLQSHTDLRLGKTADDAVKDEDEDAADGADEDVVWCQSGE